MKNKVLLISIAVVLAVSLAVVGCTGPKPSTEIVVGMTRSLTGPLSIVHTSAFGAVYPIYFKAINDAGGITVDGSSFDVAVDERDDGSVPTACSAHASDLVADIQAGDVHFLFGPTCTYFIDLVAPIANAGGVTLMTFEGGATFLKNTSSKLPSWPYVFINLSFSDWYQLQVLGQMLTDKGASTFYVAWQYDAHGQEYMDAASSILVGTYGMTMVGNTSVLHGSFDPDALITTINATNPDVVCMFCYPDEIVDIFAAAVGVNYSDPDAWVGGPGANFGWFGCDFIPPGVPIESFGDNADGVICFAVANNKTSNNMTWLYDTALSSLAYFQLDPWGHPLYWAAMQIWQEAVESEASVDAEGGFVIDQDDYKDFLAGLNSSTNSYETVLGDTWYEMFSTVLGPGGGILDYECHTGEIGQWQNGIIEIVGPVDEGQPVTGLPRYVVTANLTWPKPVFP